MGRSLNAYVAYGEARGEFSSQSEEEWPWRRDKFDYDFDTWVYAQAGIPDIDYSNHPERPSYRASQEERNQFDQAVAEWKESVGYQNILDRRHAARTDCPFDVRHGGAEGGDFDVLYLKDTITSTYWEEGLVPPLELDTDRLVLAMGWATANGLELDLGWIFWPSYW